MRKPIIGLTPSVDMEQGKQIIQPGYAESVERAGGLALMLSLTEDEEALARYLELCDGILFVGGPDIEPRHYGQELLPCCGPQNPRRDEMELKLLRAAIAADKPVLGVCRGIQVLNVALGGTLYQDVPSQYSPSMAHRMEEPYNRAIHPIQVVAGTPLAALSALEGVNSRHHQAIDTLAPGLEPMAYAGDGLIEAVWMPEKKFVWAVQWHPEAFWADGGGNFELFVQLVKAAEGA